jgi:hypothetical protein
MHIYIYIYIYNRVTDIVCDKDEQQTSPSRSHVRFQIPQLGSADILCVCMYVVRHAPYTVHVNSLKVARSAYCAEFSLC